jgi:hypothetical protein
VSDVNYLVRLKQDTQILLWQTLKTSSGTTVVCDEDEEIFLRETGGGGESG